MYSHPAEYRKILLANYLCIGFVPGGTCLEAAPTWVAGTPLNNCAVPVDVLLTTQKHRKKTKVTQKWLTVRNARLFIICLFAIFGGFVRNFGWVFAILFEVLLIEIQEEIHHFAGWGGGLRGTKVVNKHFVNKRAFPTQGPAPESLTSDTKSTRK